MSSRDEPLLLEGLDGGNPLAFLAALGTLRTLARAWPDRTVRMSWRSSDAWRPSIEADADRETVLDALAATLSESTRQPAFSRLGDDLTIPPALFREAARDAQIDAAPSSREFADFLAAFGCEATTDESGEVIRDTAFRTMAGAGHQHFLGFMRNIVGSTKREHLEKSLFLAWRYDDPVQNATLRWDPIDDSRYALQWRNPSGDPSRRKEGSMLGANRLAIEALPLFPTAPVGRRLETTGFRGRLSRDTFWTWPIWSVPLPLDAVRSLLALDDLQAEIPPRRNLVPRGIVEIYRCRRLTIGKVRNFSPAESV